MTQTPFLFVIGSERKFGDLYCKSGNQGTADMKSEVILNLSDPFHPGFVKPCVLTTGLASSDWRRDLKCS